MPASQPTTIPDCIYQVACQFPSRLAIFDPYTTLTFGKLKETSSCLAHHLIHVNGPKEEAVLLLFDVNANAVIAGLGVMRAAKFYVAVDPTFPQERIIQILKDARIKIILTDTQYEKLAHKLAGTSRTVVNIGTIETKFESAHDPVVSPSALALLNYTSGSTGTPKAVMQSHETALVQATRYAKTYKMTESDRATCFGSLAWAGSFWDSFGALASGAAVGLYDLRHYGFNQLESWLKETGVTILCGATALRQYVHDSPHVRLPDVRLIEVGGDTIYSTDVSGLQRMCPRAVIAPGLGMSEAGRVAEHFISPGTDLEPGIIPVGYPVEGVTVRLVLEDGREVKQGNVGEFVIQSEFLARGYWLQPELTAEVFRIDPQFGTMPLYFTGDLGRQLSDGKFHHLGRKDFQIKIHGYQIQATEIEALLKTIDGVSEACVVARELLGANQELVGYIVADNPSSSGEQLPDIVLPDSLPRYMHPRRYVYTASLPKTPSGKIDRRKLSSTPEAVVPLEHKSRKSTYAAPINIIEEWLATIWQEVLHIEKIGRNDSFFELGGDSIDALRIISRVRRDLEIDLSLRSLFDYPTVAKLSVDILECLES